MIRIENYTKNYGKIRALDGLSLEVEAGAVYGFLGPNGAGKTTTMRLLTGLARPDSGRAWINGIEVGGKGEDIRLRIGVLPEEPAFYPWMTPREYLRDFAAPLYNIRGKEASDRAEEMLGLVGLLEAANRRIGGFSRGMRQRLGLAQALIHKPKVLLLDEPVSALDPAGRKEVLELVDKMKGTATVILSTHILADVERVCDVVGIINKGRLILQARRETLLNEYAQPLFEIEIEEGMDAWTECIRDEDYIAKISVENQTARVLVSDVDKGKRELPVSLAKANASLRRFEIVQPSLEDIFLRLTES